jgi:xylulokinase
MSAPVPHILALDHGTSGCKVALISTRGEVHGSAFAPVRTLFLPDGGVEQEPEAWWQAFVTAARRALAASGLPPGCVEAVCVSSTLSSTVAVGQDGRPLMNCLTWMDGRAAPYVKQKVGNFPTLEGYNAHKLLRWISLTSGIPQLSGKDDIAHVLLVQNAWPLIYERTHKFLGSKDYFNLRLTGLWAASYDSASLFWVADIRDITRVHYADSLIRWLGIDRAKLPELRSAVDLLGELLPTAAEELGLPAGLKVFMGAADHQAALVGSGAVGDFDGHCYIGTSSWIECLVPFKRTDMFHSIASLASAVPGRYQCINEQDIAGGALSFLANNLLAGEERLRRAGAGEVYAALDAIAAAVPAGSHRVLFTPWLNGERTPVDSTTLRGGFHNLSLTTTLDDLVRAVFEGVAYNTRWNLTYVERFTGRPFPALTFVGGGARSDVWCQIFADVLDRPVRQSTDPIHANARGAAFIAAVGLGQLAFGDLPELVPCRRTFLPDPARRMLYDELYGTFLSIYRQNRGLYARLNRSTPAV